MSSGFTNATEKERYEKIHADDLEKFLRETFLSKDNSVLVADRTISVTTIDLGKLVKQFGFNHPIPVAIAKIIGESAQDIDQVNATIWNFIDTSGRRDEEAEKKVADYHALIESGLSDYEARDTVWPRMVILNTDQVTIQLRELRSMLEATVDNGAALQKIDDLIELCEGENDDDNPS